MAIILWNVVGLFYLIYKQLSRDLLLQAYVQICGDIILITAIVHITGNLESNYIPLYFLVVIMASVVLSRSQAFLIAAFSFSYLAENLRRTGQELRDKTGEVASLQALNENIIHSMRGGLITTDLSGRILVVNPAGAAILGRAAEELRGQRVGSILESGTVISEDAPEKGLAYMRREISYHQPSGEERILGIS